MGCAPPYPDVGGAHRPDAELCGGKGVYLGGGGGGRGGQGGPLRTSGLLSLRTPPFFFGKDRPQGPPPRTAHRQPPPTAHRQPPTANCHPLPTAATQPPTAANRPPLFNTASAVLCLAHVLTIKQRASP